MYELYTPDVQSFTVTNDGYILIVVYNDRSIKIYKNPAIY